MQKAVKEVSDLRSYHVGTLIKNTRTAKNITQEKLCSGLCDVSTLSRIERGLIVSSKFVLNALMERLGYYTNINHDGLLGEDSSLLARQKKAVSIALLNRDVSASEKLIGELEKIRDFANGLGLQFMIRSKVTLAMIKGAAGGDMGADWCLNELRRAVMITIPDFDESKIADYMLTKEELACINAMGSPYYEMKDYESSLRLQVALKENTDKFCVNKHDVASVYSAFLLNIAMLLCELGRFSESVAACEEGKAFCIEYNEFSRIPMLYYFYGKSLLRIGDNNEARIALLSGYHAARAFSRTAESEEIGRFYLDSFGVDILDASIRGRACVPDTVPDNIPVNAPDNMAVQAVLSALGDGEMSAKDLREKLNLKHKANFRDKYIDPALKSGAIEMTIPGKPNHKLQKYRAVR